MAQSNVVTNIESKTQATRLFSFKDLMFFIMYFVITYIFKNRVNDILIIPYMIFSMCMCTFLLLPSMYNSGRNNLASIYILLFADKKVYRAYYDKNLPALEKKENKDDD